MIWGEYCFAPRFPRPTEPPPIGKLIERLPCSPQNTSPSLTRGNRGDHRQPSARGAR